MQYHVYVCNLASTFFKLLVEHPGWDSERLSRPYVTFQVCLNMGTKSRSSFFSNINSTSKVHGVSLRSDTCLAVQ